MEVRTVGKNEFGEKFMYDTSSCSYPNLSFCSCYIDSSCVVAAILNVLLLRRRLLIPASWWQIDTTSSAREKICQPGFRLSRIISLGPLMSCQSAFMSGLNWRLRGRSTNREIKSIQDMNNLMYHR